MRCKYFEAGVHMKNPIKNSYDEDGLDRTTQTLDNVVVVHIFSWDKIKSTNIEYSDSKWEKHHLYKYEAIKYKYVEFNIIWI